MNAILMNQRGFVPQANQMAPVLSPTAMMPQPGALSGNARGSIRMPQMPQNQRINMGGEGLMRIGGAGIGASADGGLAAINAMTNTYGDIMDYNRAREMDEYAIREAQALEQQRRLDLQRKMAVEDNKDEPTDREKLENANEIERLESILKDLETTNLTGPFAGGIGNYIDGSGFRGEEAAKRTAKRKILSELQVNATLAFTAQTKGAITEMEMRLFLEPSPNKWRDERVWLDWINMRIDAINRVKGRMQSGETVPFYSGNQSTPSTVSEDILNEADSIVNGG